MTAVIDLISNKNYLDRPSGSIDQKPSNDSKLWNAAPTQKAALLGKSKLELSSIFSSQFIC